MPGPYYIIIKHISMVLKMSLQRAWEKFIPFFIITFLLLVIENLFAQNHTDTTKVPLLASLETKVEPAYITRASNVVFPEILKGNEAEMLPYIEKFSSEKRDYLSRMYAMGKSFLPRAAAILKKYNLPEELNILLVLESEYRGNVVSSAGAVGYWQIMDEVARTYGLKYTARLNKIENKNGKKGEKGLKTAVEVKDDRKNFNIATHTAARYLRDSKQYVNDDLLIVVASYNCGVGRVRKAIRRSGKANASFWDIKNYLPAVTRAYVMNFITLNVIFNNYDMFAQNKLSFTPEKIMLADEREQNVKESSADVAR